MVLWLKKKWKDIVFACLITCLFLLPYITKDFLGIEHDTFFHVSRIEQLSKAIQHGQFFPAVYPYENHHYGYAPLYSIRMYSLSSLLCCIFVVHH